MGRARQGPCTLLLGDSMRARTLPLPEGPSLPPREGTAIAWHYAMSNAVTAWRSLYPGLHPAVPVGPVGRTPCIQPGTLQQRGALGMHDMGHWCHWDWAGSRSGAPVLPLPSSIIPPDLVPLDPVSPCAHQRCELLQATISPLCHL